MSQHRYDAKDPTKFCKSKFMLQYNDAKILLVESFPCNSKDELLQREQYWIDQLREFAVNQQKAHTGLTKVEYLQQYRDEHKEQYKQYYQGNKDKFKVYEQKYSVKRAEYRSLESTKERRKQYYQENKQRIFNETSQVIQCECGALITKGKHTQHQKSKKHEMLMESNMNKYILNKI